MKFKFLVLLSLAAFLLLSGCRSTDNANVGTANANLMNSNTTVTRTNETATTNPALKTNIEAALKAKGFNNITVDTSTTPATLRGTYPKGRLPELIQTAQQANGGKPVENAATEEK